MQLQRCHQWQSLLGMSVLSRIGIYVFVSWFQSSLNLQESVMNANGGEAHEEMDGDTVCFG